jgi:hypothetical protein
LKFTGTARVFESQDAAVEAILGGNIVAGDVVVIRYEGPRGGPGMQEMLYPTSYLKSKGLGKDCALITDGRFSGGSSGLSIGHVFQKQLKVVQLVWLKMVIPFRSIFQIVPFILMLMMQLWHIVILRKKQKAGIQKKSVNVKCLKHLKSMLSIQPVLQKAPFAFYNL